MTGEKRQNYLEYLGRPISDTSIENISGDTWLERKNNYNYDLSLRYNKDTVGSAYSIHYSFSNGLFYKSAVILVDSLDTEWKP